MVKGLRDALKEKMETCKDLSAQPEKIQKIAEEIEIAMFGKEFNIFIEEEKNIFVSNNAGSFIIKSFM